MEVASDDSPRRHPEEPGIYLCSPADNTYDDKVLHAVPLENAFAPAGGKESEGALSAKGGRSQRDPLEGGRGEEGEETLQGPTKVVARPRIGSGPVSGSQSRFTNVATRMLPTKLSSGKTKETRKKGKRRDGGEEEKEKQVVSPGRGHWYPGTAISMSRTGGRVILLMILTVTLSRAQQFRCPETKGFYPDPEQCDLYYACVGGQAEERLCKDGLVFRDDNPKKELCDIPANVPCGERTLLQEPHPSKGCPRSNGYFTHEDPTACDRFVNCIDGVAQVVPCPPGLIYEPNMSSCVWPADASRLCENVKRDVLDDGFVCPDGDVAGPSGRILPHPTYPHPEDCAKFYICKNGVVPQKGQCESGTVYNEESFRCTEPEYVQGCEDYYKRKN